jgi:hypothetical protein
MADKRRRRDEARRARLEQERRSRARKTRNASIAAGAAIVALVVALIVALSGSGGGFQVQYVSTPSVDPSKLTGISTTPPPWPTNTNALAARLNAESLPPLGPMEGQVLHIHQHIDIYIRGQHIGVPAAIGIAQSQSVILYAPVHTHTPDGIIHVESPTQRDFSLGEFFDVWGVLFTPTCIGAYCNTGNERLQVFANGKVVTGNPRQLKLVEHEEIVVTFGTPDQIPQPYPVSYRFPAGL